MEMNGGSTARARPLRPCVFAYCNRSGSKGDFQARHGITSVLRWNLCPVIPFEKKLLPTGIIILRDYLEIGNALPYRKNYFQELFGSVIPIKSVMDAWAGIFFF